MLSAGEWVIKNLPIITADIVKLFSAIKAFKMPKLFNDTM